MQAFLVPTIMMDEKINKSIMFLIYLLIIFIVLGSNLRTMPIALIILLILSAHLSYAEMRMSRYQWAVEIKIAGNLN